MDNMSNNIILTSWIVKVYKLLHIKEYKKNRNNKLRDRVAIWEVMFYPDFRIYCRIVMIS
jgi:hypothetical protein